MSHRVTVPAVRTTYAVAMFNRAARSTLRNDGLLTIALLNNVRWVTRITQLLIWVCAVLKAPLRLFRVD
jgi:hypothetical protein